MNCDTCNRTFVNKYTLEKHRQTAKFCLEQRGQEPAKIKFNCNFCLKELSSIQRLESHRSTCKLAKQTKTEIIDDISNIDLKNMIDILSNRVDYLEEKLKRKQTETSKRKQIKLTEPLLLTSDISVSSLWCNFTRSEKLFKVICWYMFKNIIW